MIEIPTGLPAELVPLSWLIGVWEGTGVLDYTIGEGESAERVSREFGQRVSFSHDGLPYLNYSSYTWLLGDDGNDGDDADADADAHDVVAHDADRQAGDGDEPASARRPIEPLTAETGYWRLSRLHIEGDVGPGMLPGVGPRPFNTAQSVEALRNSAEGFDIEVSIVHPTGVSELYLGQVKGPRIDLATDAVVRTRTAKEYAAATRIYGLVDNHLLWAWDIAALGQDLRTHASARLAKVD
ncbi:FABP family protein [Herbiconiux sp. CPCC 203407]|uniref:Peroxynitrite isomerase n=1 Tax=Herbiconiux oxytropis TaxID=2970915 RepID=A0AA41XFJ5_9MICO|nr:FABP family protein [Herbiconiux oxytropis]MCS5721106.1 FABP family protein [Herbiconiux oxytropis]MCS5724758.1 FABP family protein [Herbiconiux oxytropis]